MNAASDRREALYLLTMTHDQAAALSRGSEWHLVCAARRRAIEKAAAATPRRWHCRVEDVLAELSFTMGVALAPAWPAPTGGDA
jgi:hypothetical protein